MQVCSGANNLPGPADRHSRVENKRNMNVDSEQDQKLGKDRVYQSYEPGDDLVHTNQIFRSQQPSLANVAGEGAECLFHDELTRQKHWDSKQHSDVDSVITNQTGKVRRVKHRCNQHQGKPADCDGEQNSPAQIPAISVNQPDYFL